MPVGRLLGFSAAIALAWSAAAEAGITVSFNQPERYTDVGLYGEYSAKGRQATMREIEKHLEGLAARYLRPGQRLVVDVQDIDLAGRYEPWRSGAYNVRVLNDVTWPRIAISYRLEQEGATPVVAEESIADLNYLMHVDARRTSDPLRHEKAMLERWFKARFGEQVPSTH
jgi:hypothetical protein